MAEEVCTLAVAEVQEVAGDTFQKVAVGPVRVFFKPGYSKVAGALQVEDVSIDFRLDSSSGPYRKLDSRTFIFSTQDAMSFYYVTFKPGTSEKDLENAEFVFKQLAQRNRPVLAIPGAEEAEEAIAAALTHDAEKQEVVKQGVNPLQQMGGFFQGLSKRAAEDTAKLQEIAQKAGADTLFLAGHGAAALAGAMQGKPQNAALKDAPPPELVSEPST